MPEIATVPIWKKSRAERSAAFEKASAGVVPAEEKTPSVSEQIRMVLPLIRKKRNQGFTIDQIAEFMKKPEIGLGVSPTSIRRELSVWEKKQTANKQAQLAALLPKGPSAAGQPLAGATKKG